MGDVEPRGNVRGEGKRVKGAESDVKGERAATTDGDLPAQFNRSHRNLDVWKRSVELSKLVYELTSHFPNEEKYGLAQQMRRAAVSVASNIAEGAARRTGKEFVNFLHMARGSLSELDTQLEIMTVSGLGTRSKVDPVLDHVSRMLSGLISHVISRAPKGGISGLRIARTAQSTLVLLFTLSPFLFTISSCAAKGRGKSTLAVYQEALGEGTREGIERLREDFKREKPLGYEEPVVPVMSPPETMLVWFANQKIGDEIFVHGHWVQIVIRPWEWNPEILNNPSPSPGSGSHGPPLPLHPESKPAPEGH